MSERETIRLVFDAETSSWTVPLVPAGPAGALTLDLFPGLFLLFDAADCGRCVAIDLKNEGHGTGAEPALLSLLSRLIGGSTDVLARDPPATTALEIDPDTLRRHLPPLAHLARVRACASDVPADQAAAVFALLSLELSDADLAVGRMLALAPSHEALATAIATLDLLDLVEPSDLVASLDEASANVVVAMLDRVAACLPEGIGPRALAHRDALLSVELVSGGGFTEDDLRQLLEGRAAADPVGALAELPAVHETEQFTPVDVADARPLGVLGASILVRPGEVTLSVDVEGGAEDDLWGYILDGDELLAAGPLDAVAAGALERRYFIPEGIEAVKAEVRQRPSAQRLDRALDAAKLAVQDGRRAVGLEYRGRWEDVARTWEACATRWLLVDDGDRCALAHAYAAEAMARAGKPASSDLAYAFGQGWSRSLLGTRRRIPGLLPHEVLAGRVAPGHD